MHSSHESAEQFVIVVHDQCVSLVWEVGHVSNVTYIIHGVVITVLALAMRDVVIYPSLKFALVALVTVPLCFGLSHLILIRKLPYTDRVL
jgi:hypothetical protein